MLPRFVLIVLLLPCDNAASKVDAGESPVARQAYAIGADGQFVQLSHESDHLKLMRHASIAHPDSLGPVSKVPEHLSPGSAGHFHFGLFSSGMYDCLHVLWLVLTSFAFLVPGMFALRERWYWPAVLFSVQAIICAAYHFCDANGPQTLFGADGCPDLTMRGLRHADHGLAYFIFLQVVLAILGPEDPFLQRIEQNAEAHLGDHARRLERCLVNHRAPEHHPLGGAGLPLDVLLLNRVGTSMGMLAFLWTYSSWALFHRQCFLWCTALVILNVGSFWLLRARCAIGVLLRLGFWRRTAQCVLTPIAMSGVMFIVMESTGNAPWLHGLWHLTLSALAVLLMWRILLGDSVSFSYEDLQRNPVIVHHVLWVTPIFGVGMATLYTAMHSPLGGVPLSESSAQLHGYLFALGSMLTAVVAVAMWGVVDLVSAFYDEEQQKQLRGSGHVIQGSVIDWMWGCVVREGHVQGYPLSNARSKLKPPMFSRLSLRKPAVYMGYLAVLSGFLGAICRESLASLHTGLMTVFIATQTAAIVLLTLSVYGSEPTASVSIRWRAGVVGVLLAAVLMLLLVPLHMNGWILGAFAIPTPLRIAFQGTVLGLHFAWPLTWFEEAQLALNFWVQWYRLQPA